MDWEYLPVFRLNEYAAALPIVDGLRIPPKCYLRESLGNGAFLPEELSNGLVLLPVKIVENLQSPSGYVGLLLDPLYKLDYLVLGFSQAL